MMRSLLKKLFGPAENILSDRRCGRAGGNCQCQTLIECVRVTPTTGSGVKPPPAAEVTGSFKFDVDSSGLKKVVDEMKGLAGTLRHKPDPQDNGYGLMEDQDASLPMICDDPNCTDPICKAKRRADAEDAIRTDYIKTGRGVLMMIDAEFIVWRKSQTGPPIPSLDMLDPRRSMSWDVIRERHIAIRSLSECDRRLTFEQIVAKYPCPAESEF